MPFGPAAGHIAGACPAATIRPGTGAPMSVSVFASVEAGVIGPSRAIAVIDRSNSKIMNAREASST